MKPGTTYATFVYLILILLSAWYVFPLVWALATSVKHPGMVFDGRWLPYERSHTTLIDGQEQEVRIVEEREETFLVRVTGTGTLREVPRKDLERLSPNWDNYVQAWHLVPFGRYFLNSLFVSLAMTLGQLVTCSLGGYAFSRLQFPGRDAIFLLYLATLMIPSPVLTVPIYLLLREYHLLNTYQGVILPGLFSAYGTFLLRQFFLAIPKELEDAARIDGSGRFGIYLRIILTDPDMLTLPVGLAHLNDIYLFEYARLMAGSLISIAPAILMYLFFQRYITRGIVMTGLKG
jgi:multiple sugar transport system permease protein